MEAEMDQYGIGSASWPEIVWSAATLPGTGVCFVLMLVAYADLRWLRVHGLNGERRLLALNSVAGEAISTVVLACFSVVGVWYMTVPSTHTPVTRGQIALVSTFVLAALLLTAHAVLRYYWRAEYIHRRMLRRRGSTAAPPVTMVVDTQGVDSLEITTKAVEADGT